MTVGIIYKQQVIVGDRINGIPIGPPEIFGVYSNGMEAVRKLEWLREKHREDSSVQWELEIRDVIETSK